MVSSGKRRQGYKPFCLYVYSKITLIEPIRMIHNEIVEKMDKDINENKPQDKTACSGKLKDPTNYPNAIYGGQRIYFCTTACLRAFELAPEPVITGEIEHPIRKTDEV